MGLKNKKSGGSKRHLQTLNVYELSFYLVSFIFCYHNFFASPSNLGCLLTLLDNAQTTLPNLPTQVCWNKPVAAARPDNKAPQDE